MRRFCITLFYIIPFVIANAQNKLNADNKVVMLPNAGYFIVAMIAGLILAVAFQLILTNLSVAAGLNVLGTVTRTDNGKNSSSNTGGSSTNVATTVRKISSSFGIWTMITASVALFFASLLAGELSLTFNPTIAIVLGLVIWGLFYVVMMTIEINSVSSLVGSLVRLAASGLRSAFQVTSFLFSKSDEQKIVDTAEKVTEAVKNELFADIDADDVKDQIQNYINQLKPQKPDMAILRQEIGKLLNDVEIRAIETHDGLFFDRDTFIAKLKTNNITEGKAKEMVDTMNQAFAKIKEEASSDKDTTSKVIDSTMRVVGLSSEDAKKYREKFENYLRNTGREELNPEGIKKDLEKLFSDPKAGSDALKERLSHIDKSTIASIISQRTDMSEEEVHSAIDKVEQVVNQITGRISDTAVSLKDGIFEKVRNYLNSTGRDELNYEGIQHDIQKLLHDPKAGIEALTNRIKSLDRNSIKALLSARSDISEEDAERIISRIETARDNMMSKIEQMKAEIQKRINDVKEEAIHQADEIRKTVATAAWWAFATAIVSGIAAVIGGIIATNSGI